MVAKEWRMPKKREGGMEGGRKAFSPERLPEGRSSYLDILWLQGLQPCPLTCCVPISPHSSLDASDMSPHFQVRLVRFVCALFVLPADEH